MSRISLSFVALLCFIATTGQTKRSFELSFIGRYDQHARNYITPDAGPGDNIMSLMGTSHGLNLGYRHKIRKNTSLFLSLGYYKLGINRIRNRDSRTMEDVIWRRLYDPYGYTAAIYSTTKYYYNNLALTVGLNRTIPLKKTLHFDFGAEGVVYHCFSQYYEISYYIDYSLAHKSRPLSFGFNGTAGILKEYGKFYIRPALCIPVYQQLRGDKVFWESEKMKISKWLGGLGVIIRVGRYF